MKDLLLQIHAFFRSSFLPLPQMIKPCISMRFIWDACILYKYSKRQTNLRRFCEYPVAIAAFSAHASARCLLHCRLFSKLKKIPTVKYACFDATQSPHTLQNVSHLMRKHIIIVNVNSSKFIILFVVPPFCLRIALHMPRKANTVYTYIMRLFTLYGGHRLPQWQMFASF